MTPDRKSLIAARDALKADTFRIWCWLFPKEGKTIRALLDAAIEKDDKP